MKRVKPIPNKILLICIVLILIIKIVFFGLVHSDLLNIQLGGGSDADYYDSYAQGYIDLAVNIWPVILKKLYNLNLYSRENISYIFLILNLTVIPILVCKLAGLSFKKEQKYYLTLFLLILLYPTLYFYTFDIYRDVFMVVSFLIGCIIVKRSTSSQSVVSFIFYFVLSIMIGVFLVTLRPYLGYGFLLSLFLWNIKLTTKRIVAFGLLYLVSLYFVFLLGALNQLIKYRELFDVMGGGSTMGLDFTNPVLFIPNLILSTLGQLFGLYITNPLAVMILIIETVPFIFMLGYVIKNIKLADKFLRFLIIFFVLYASVWLIGNDNLGTAVRLRMYNYIAVYICFFYILRLKKNLQSS